ncbi:MULTISPECIES: DUF4278 domain-containing protein [Brasilonema]|jgi:hypothetical protein|uniref:DUF4278 domain-containing protein n=1 Tax=Brasilonema TaxID=383614 RepID=UPI001FE7A4D4|nr:MULTISPECIES: DUF4278 domain-containing protein [Brasilonema]
MALFFLLPLFTGLVGGYIFKKSTDEIGYLVGVFAAICIVLGLIFAPWQILLLVLILTLTVPKKLLGKNEYQVISSEEVKQEPLPTDKQEQVVSKPENYEVVKPDDYEVELIRNYQHMIY